MLYALQELQSSLAAADSALKAAQAETQEAVRSGNDRYNQLMAAKLQQQTALEGQLQQVLGCRYA